MIKISIIIFTYPPSHVHSSERTPALSHSQFPVQDISQLQCRRMEQPLLVVVVPSNVVQYGNQTTIAFVLPPVLPEIRDFLMNGGCLSPVKAGMKQSSLYMFKQSSMGVWDVLQIVLPLVKDGALVH